MKDLLSQLRLHQKVWAQVNEVIAQNEVIINFNGDLLRVVNETGRQLRVGERVLTEVQEINPLKLKVITQTQRRSNYSIDVQA